MNSKENISEKKTIKYYYPSKVVYLNLNYKELHSSSEIETFFSNILESIIKSPFFEISENKEENLKILREFTKVETKYFKFSKKFLKTFFPVVTGINNPKLRREAEEVEKFDYFIEIWSAIIETAMKYYDGVWLAAPQIWINKRIISVVLFDKNNKPNKIVTMINPKIISASIETNIKEEECLSIPWLKWEIKRSNEIEIEYHTIKQKLIKLRLKWFNARIIQHEIDHLDWILISDYILQNKKKQVT